MSRITVFEPASPSEAYEYYKHAAALAAKEQTIVVLRLTTHVCHAREKIKFNKYQNPSSYKIDFNKENGPYIPLTTLALDMKRESIKKLHQARQFIKDAGLNREFRSGTSQGKGLITSGLTYLSVLDVLENIKNRPDILKLGDVNPLDGEGILSFLKAHDEILILEELDDILEIQIKAMAYDAGLKIKLIGKSDDEDYVGEYTPDKTKDKIAAAWPDLIAHHGPEYIVLPFEVPARPAQLLSWVWSQERLFCHKKSA